MLVHQRVTTVDFTKKWQFSIAMLNYQRVPGTNKCVSTAWPSTGTDMYHTWTLRTQMEIIIIDVWLLNESWQVGCNLANNRIFGEYIYSTSIIRWGWKSSVLVLGIKIGNHWNKKWNIKHPHVWSKSTCPLCFIHVCSLLKSPNPLEITPRCLHGTLGHLDGSRQGFAASNCCASHCGKPRCVVAKGHHGGLNMEKWRISISTYGCVWN